MTDQQMAKLYVDLMTEPSLHVADMKLRQRRFMWAQARLAESGAISLD